MENKKRKKRRKTVKMSSRFTFKKDYHNNLLSNSQSFPSFSLNPQHQQSDKKQEEKKTTQKPQDKQDNIEENLNTEMQKKCVILPSTLKTD